MARNLAVLAFGAAVAVATIALAVTFSAVRDTSAQAETFDCPSKAGPPPNDYTCTFTNLTGGEVTDIHILFRGEVARQGSTTPTAGCTKKNTIVPIGGQGNQPIETQYDCVFNPMESGGTFEMTVVYEDPTGQKRPAHVIEWYWTRRGTPVFNPTSTPTRTTTQQQQPTQTPTLCSFFDVHCDLLPTITRTPPR